MANFRRDTHTAVGPNKLHTARLQHAWQPNAEPGHRRRVFSMLDSQSRPSNRPSPLIADVLKIAQSRLLMLDSPRPSATAASSSAPGRSCRHVCACQQAQDLVKVVDDQSSAWGGAAPVCWRI